MGNRSGNYDPKNIIDGNPLTAWSEGKKGYGEDEWIEIKSRHPYLINSVSIYNGNHKSENDYRENGKLNEIEVMLGDADSFRYTFTIEEGSKKPEVTKLNLLNPVEIDYMTITIRSGGNSELYKNTFISEVVTE